MKNKVLLVVTHFLNSVKLPVRDLSGQSRPVDDKKWACRLLALFLWQLRACARPHPDVLALKHEDGGAFPTGLDWYCEQRVKRPRVQHSLQLRDVAERHRLQLRLTKHKTSFIHHEKHEKYTRGRQKINRVSSPVCKETAPEFSAWNTNCALFDPF